MSFFMRPSRSTYVLQNGAKRFMKSHLDFRYSNNFTRYFPRHISFLFQIHMLSGEIVNKFQCDFTKNLAPLCSCLSSIHFQNVQTRLSIRSACFEIEPSGNNAPIVRVQQNDMQSFTLTHVQHVSFGQKKKDINRNSYRTSIHFSFKVHIEGHKILRNLHLTFVLCSASQK